MSKYSKPELIQIFSELGIQLKNPDNDLAQVIKNEHQYNAWFTPHAVTSALTAIGNMLKQEDITSWLNQYSFKQSTKHKRIGLILAGNLPLVGFHDVLCVLLTGNYALIKSSAQDARLIRYVLELLVSIDDGFKNQFDIVERLKDFDAVIATGSNNTSRYFEYYFGSVPHIIRKNRNSVALLTGSETASQLTELGHDIFDYYGLGCRNVSKLLVPTGYNFNFFFESIEVYQPVINHHKYNNNYDYNKSIYLVNSDKHLDNGFLLLKEDKRMASPLAVLYFEYYSDLEAATALLESEAANIQCIVTSAPLQVKNQTVDFGKSQQPALWDYADGIDTMAFLSA